MRIPRKRLPTLQLIIPLFAAALSAHAGTTKPMNILLIFMEDMGPHISAYGNNTAPTPALDALAAESVVFENAYCVQATCSPSRSSLYSGQYPHQTGHMGLAGSFGYYMKEGFTTFLSILKQADYFTGVSYKIHVNPESAISKDYDLNYNVSRFTKIDKTDTKDFRQSIAYFEDFLGQRPDDRPFFFMAQTHDTHEPFNRGPFNKAPDEAPYTTLTGDDVQPLASFGEGLPFGGWVAKQVASYYNAIQRVDAFVGGILAALEEEGLADSTVVVFSADHGPSFARGKLSNHELGLHIPLIIRWPDSTVAGTRNESLVSLLDLPATFVDIAEQAVPEKYEGRSLKEFASSGMSKTPWRSSLAAEYTSHTTIDYWPMRSIRNERYKLIESKLAGTEAGDYILQGGRVQREGESADMTAGLQASTNSSSLAIYQSLENPPQFELYDLQEDAGETRNLAENPEYQAILQGLITELRAWEKATNDPFTDPDFFRGFTEAQLEKQKSIRAWEAINGKDKFWGKPIAKGEWSEWIDSLP